MKMKKKSGGGGANWMDTYGDMVTLLLCFFVLLYSMSTISEENWKALVMSFNPSAVMELSEADPQGNLGPVSDPPTEDGKGLDPGLSQENIDEDIVNLYEMLQKFIAAEGIEDSMSVREGDGRVYISFGNAVFFDGNSYNLRQEAYPILDSVCGMLDGIEDSIEEVRVMGHTAVDSAGGNRVDTDRKLSSNRATNVIIYIQEHSSVHPAKLISEGMGQWRPIAPNDTPEGRARNRRVEMVVSGRNLTQESMGLGIVQQYVTTEYLTTE